MPFDGASFEALDKIDKVIDLLAREDHWCKHQLRRYGGRRCILGALVDADARVVLQGPILLAIKQVTGRDYLRIERFNDHISTSHGLVLRVLHQTRDNILSGRVAAPPARPSRWARLQRLFA